MYILDNLSLIKRSLLITILCLTSTLITAQNHLPGYAQDAIESTLMTNHWTAQWISVPNVPMNEFGIYHFRKIFTLADKPTESFIINISADNRYKLYINNKFVSLGPSKGDVYNWNFSTIDISPYLKKGKNIVAAVVWNYAERAGSAQMSGNKTGFILQGNTKKERIIDTNDSWLCSKDLAYSIWSKGKARGYCEVGPCENFNSNLYPWGWKSLDFDDSNWKKARKNLKGVLKGYSIGCPRPLLVPSPIPPMERTLQRFSKLRIAEGIQVPSSFPNIKTTIKIPSHSKVRLLLDQGELTTGYPTFLFSKGKNSSIRIGYSESLYEKNKKYHTKGNRDEVNNKSFYGYEDHITADGGNNRSYTPLWWRTWRYFNIIIETQDEPLIIDDIYSTFSAYPFKLASKFEAKDHPELNKILKIGWHTARLCAHETYMDCPYYEQLQYFGDTRIQAMVTIYNTNDKYLVRNAIEDGRQAMLADGFTLSRYPTKSSQFIPSYSLSWIGMAHDYWRYRKDDKFIKSLLPSFRNVLGWYENLMKDNGSLDKVPFWFFADWAKGYNFGSPIIAENGNSSYQDLVYLLALENVADMEKNLGAPEFGDYYQKLANQLKQSIKKHYFDKEKGLFAEDFSHTKYSQHVNSLAVLANVVDGQEAKDIMLKTLSDKSLIQTTIYYTYYLHQALYKAGLGDKILSHLDIWKNLMSYGVTTWPEQPLPSRSDCHGWGATPNIDFFRIILGVDSDAPGFEKIVISPHIGNLTEVSGTVPHPQGDINVVYKIKNKRLKATIELPCNLTGRFVWNNKEYPLHGGTQKLTLNNK